MASIYQYDLDSETAVFSLRDPQEPQGASLEGNGSSRGSLEISSGRSGNFEFKIEEMKSSDYLDIAQEVQIFGIDQSNTPPPQYSKMSEKLRRMASSNSKIHGLQCSTFCGGRNCKYENPLQWSNGEENVAFPGLFSHWVTDKILATARPATLLFTEYKVLDRFKEAGIKAVINLQTQGEHPHCGPPQQSSGFTYDPEDLMKENIYYYNYSWPDYGTPTIDNILDVVKVIDFSCIDGKIAIHCHAGLGRTGVAIACYLIYSLRLPPEDSIARVREKRPGSIQTRGQIEMVHRFSIQLRSLWTLYPANSLASYTISQYTKRQSKLFHGEERKKYKYIPKIIDVICGQLCELAEDDLFQYHSNVVPDNLLEEEVDNGRDETDEREDWLVVKCDTEYNRGLGIEQDCLDLPNEHLIQSLLGTCPCSTSEGFHRRILALEMEFNNRWLWESLPFETDPTVLFSLLFTFLSRLKEPLLATEDCHRINFIEHTTKIQKLVFHTVLDTIKKVVPLSLLTIHIQSITYHLASIFCHCAYNECSGILIDYINNYLSQ